MEEENSFDSTELPEEVEGPLGSFLGGSIGKPTDGAFWQDQGGSLMGSLGITAEGSAEWSATLETEGRREQDQIGPLVDRLVRQIQGINAKP